MTMRRWMWIFVVIALGAFALAAAGRFLAPAGVPLGLNWQMMVALLTGFGDMAGIDLVGVQVIHRLKLGDEHGVVVVLAEVARDLALFELRDHAGERGELRQKLVGLFLSALAELPHYDMTDHRYFLLFIWRYRPRWPF